MRGWFSAGTLALSLGRSCCMHGGVLMGRDPGGKEAAMHGPRQALMGSQEARRKPPCAVFGKSCWEARRSHADWSREWMRCCDTRTRRASSFHPSRSCARRTAGSAGTRSPSSR